MTYVSLVTSYTRDYSFRFGSSTSSAPLLPQAKYHNTIKYFLYYYMMK